MRRCGRHWLWAVGGRPEEGGEMGGIGGGEVSVWLSGGVEGVPGVCCRRVGTEAAAVESAAAAAVAGSPTSPLFPPAHLQQLHAHPPPPTACRAAGRAGGRPTTWCAYATTDDCLAEACSIVEQLGGGGGGGRGRACPPVVAALRRVLHAAMLLGMERERTTQPTAVGGFFPYIHVWAQHVTHITRIYPHFEKDNNLYDGRDLQNHRVNKQKQTIGCSVD